MDKKSLRQEYVFEEISPDEQARRSSTFCDLLKKRRSVRDFSSRPVAEKIIEDLIISAGTAPSGANMQPWRFVVVTKPMIKKAIRIAAEKEEKLNYEQRFPQRWLDDLAHLGTTFSKPYLESAPVLIVIFKIDYGIDAGGQKIKHYYVNESVGIATGMLIAAIHNAGLVTVTHTPSPMKFLQEILKRPQNEKAFMLLPVGYPAAKATVPVLNKKKLDEIMVKNP
ncbi:MAG: nitroreductase family protein [Calditrichaeota bacterium]|nr:MAG: nitroreductase family protein [Calditrichota bacterium]